MTTRLHLARIREIVRQLLLWSACLLTACVLLLGARSFWVSDTVSTSFLGISPVVSSQWGYVLVNFYPTYVSTGYEAVADPREREWQTQVWLPHSRFWIATRRSEDGTFSLIAPLWLPALGLGFIALALAHRAWRRRKRRPENGFPVVT